jgi:hypothetical protein
MRPFAAVEAVKEGCDRALEEGKLVVVAPGWGYGSHRGHTAMGVSYLTFMKYVVEEAARRGVNVRVPIESNSKEAMAVIKSIVRESYLKEGHPEMYDEVMTEFTTNATITCLSYFSDEPGCSMLVYVGGLGGGSGPSITGGAKQHGAMVIGGSTRWSGMYQTIMMADYSLITDECYAAADAVAGDPKSLSTVAASEILKFVLIAVGIIGVLAGIAGAGSAFNNWLAL